jgi:hypothetical protein
MKAQQYRTQRPESPEDLAQPLYDSANYAAAGAASVTFFSVPRGANATLIRNGVAAAVAKTFRDTNSENANVVPTKLWKIEGVSVGWRHGTPGDPANPTDRDELREGGYLHFRIVDKDIVYLPLVLIPDANPWVVASTTVTATTLLGGNGGGGAPAYRLRVPITINPYENFTVEMVFDGSPVIAHTLDIILALHGYMRRPT